MSVRRLIALDLDGTALVDHKFMPERTRLAILAALGEGILVVPATGRSYRDIPPAILAIPGISYFITSNGANVLDGRTGKSVCTDLIPWEKSAGVLHILKEYEVQPSVHLKGGSINLRSTDPRVAARYGNTDYFTRHSVEDLEEFVKRERTDVEKIFAVLFRKSQKAELTARITSAYALSVSASGPDNIEFNSPTASKGNGISLVCGRLGIKRDQVAVIGDSTNDISMFHAAGCRIAMGNAEPPLMELADHVTDVCERAGAALAIEKIVNREW